MIEFISPPHAPNVLPTEFSLRQHFENICVSKTRFSKYFQDLTKYRSFNDICICVNVFMCMSESVCITILI